MSQDNTHTTVFAGRDESASETLQKIGLKADQTGSKLSKMGQLAGGFALGQQLTNALDHVKKFASESITAYQTVGGEVMRLQRSTGGTAEDASKLRFAFQETGIGVDAAGISLRTFSKHVLANDDAIKALQIRTRGANGEILSTNDILLQVAERFKNMPAGIEKTATAVNLFGRSGQQMLSFLNQGKDGLIALEEEASKYGLVMTGSNLMAVRENIIAQREYHAALQGTQMQVGSALLPIITRAVTGFSEFLVQVRPLAKEFAEELKPAVALVAFALRVVITDLSALGKFFIDHKGAAEAFGKGFWSLAAGITAVKGAAWAAKKEIFGINTALAATPIGRIVTIAVFLGLATKALLDNLSDTATPGHFVASKTGGRGATGAWVADGPFTVPTKDPNLPSGMQGPSGFIGPLLIPKKKPKPSTPSTTDTTTDKSGAFNLAKAVGIDYAKGLSGTSSNIASEITKMISTAYSAAKSGKTDPAGLISALKTQQKQLRSLAADRDLTIQRLVDAQANLKNLQDQSTQLASSISSGIAGSYSITSGNAPQTLSEMLSGMTRNADRARQLSQALKKLKSQGLDPKLLQEIAGAGTERGLDVAQQIMIGGASGVRSLNSLQASIADYAQAAGGTVADATYAGGISIAEKLVKSLTDEKGKILDSIKDLATSIQKIFDDAITALAGGSQSKADSFAKKLGNLINKYPGTATLLDPTIVTKPVVPVIENPPSDWGSFRSGERGDTYQITVTDSIGADSIAQKVVTAIYTLNRTNGKNLVLD